jgi:hypothetical protein
MAFFPFGFFLMIMFHFLTMNYILHLFFFKKNEPSFLHRTQKITSSLSTVVMHSKLKGLEGVLLTHKKIL